MELPEIRNKEDLEKKNVLYTQKIEFWKFLEMAYEGGPDFLSKVITQNVRESDSNYAERLNDAICFNYSQSIVDLFNFYLTEKKVERKFGKLKDDELFRMFQKNVDLNGTDYIVFVNDVQKAASVTGSVGLLIDKPDSVYKTRADHIKYGIYPYCAVYTLPNVYDWIIRVNRYTGKPELVYLKLRESDGTYYLWYLDRWERWTENKKGAIEMRASGDNPIGEIPFIWVQNIKSITSPLHGKSDISEISYVVGSVARNLSSGDEIIKFAGFPMMRMPDLLDRDDGSSEQEVSPKSILPFNPEDGESGKPDWLETAVQQPIEAILDWTDRKVDEIYRIAHLSGVHGQRKSNNEVASGLALRYEFQQLTAVLSKKAENITETEYKIAYYWLAWQNQRSLFDAIEIIRDRSYNLEDLSVGIENTIKVMDRVRSPTFRRESEKKLIIQELPNLDDDNRAKMFSEIDTLDEDKPVVLMQPKAASNLEGSK